MKSLTFTPTELLEAVRADVNKSKFCITQNNKGNKFLSYIDPTSGSRSRIVLNIDFEVGFVESPMTDDDSLSEAQRRLKCQYGLCSKLKNSSEADTDDTYLTKRAIFELSEHIKKDKNGITQVQGISNYSKKRQEIISEEDRIIKIRFPYIQDKDDNTIRYLAPKITHIDKTDKKMEVIADYKNGIKLHLEDIPDYFRFGSKVEGVASIYLLCNNYGTFFQVRFERFNGIIVINEGSQVDFDDEARAEQILKELGSDPGNDPDKSSEEPVQSASLDEDDPLDGE